MDILSNEKINFNSIEEKIYKALIKFLLLFIAKNIPLRTKPSDWNSPKYNKLKVDLYSLPKSASSLAFRKFSPHRNIYGKILSSANRKVEVKQYLIASISYGKKKNPEIDKNESIERSYQFAIKKFGKNGYAVNKSYVDDLKYKKFLENIQYLIDNKELFIELAILIYDELY